MQHHPKHPYVSWSPQEKGDEPQHFADCVVIVIGNNNSWGKGATLNEARKLARNPTKWLAFIAHKDTTVSEFDAHLTWQPGFAPRLIASQGIKPEDAKV